MLLRLQNIPLTDVVHAFTTTTLRNISPFNLADHVGPNRLNAIDNRQILCDELGLDFDRLTTVQQVHKGNIAVIDRELAGAGRHGRSSAIENCDGMITNLPDVPLMTFSADCPPILIYDPKRKTLATLHASWRALADGIILNAVKLFVERFNCDPANLYAGIGPSAGPCCYQVGDDFCQVVSEHQILARCITADKEQYRFDLWTAVRESLKHVGLSDRHVETMGCCSICDNRFFSYRRQGADAGRYALIAAIRNA